MTVEACYTIVAADEALESIPINELRSSLEKGSEEVKVDTMKKVLTLMANGHSCDQLLMSCIQYVLPLQKNKLLKKLLLSFFEGCEKTNEDGKLKREMILVCNALRNDLQHPNEFVRGTTLRFLCKLKEAEIIEPLVPSVRTCLEHRHIYVRKNAVLSLINIYKNFDYLIPDAPELLFQFLMKENDSNCRRNAFIALIAIDMTKAVEFFYIVSERLEEFDIGLQMTMIEFIRRDLVSGLADKALCTKVVTLLLSSPSGMVKYEAAYTLMSLSSSNSAIKAVATCFIDLASKESDNNVKLISLQRLNSIRKKYPSILNDLVINILPILSSSDIDVNKMCLDIILETLSLRQVDEVVSFIKKELCRLYDEFEQDKNSEFRKILINALFSCGKLYSDTSASVIDILLDLVDDSSSIIATTSLNCLRELTQLYTVHRNRILTCLLDKLPTLSNIKVSRGILWIMGNFSSALDEIELAFTRIIDALGPLPFALSDEVAEETVVQKPITTTRILADGTYATETALGSNKASENSGKHSLKKFMLEGNFFVGALLSSCLVKLIGQLQDLNVDNKKINELKAKSLFIMCNLIKLGKSALPSTKIDSDSYTSILICMRVIGFAGKKIPKRFLDKSLSEFDKVLEQVPFLPSNILHERVLLSKCDDMIPFRFIKDSSLNSNDDFSEDLNKAINDSVSSAQSRTKLDTVVQLTGFSDPVYAEAFVENEKHDVVIVNQTSETLRNLTVELHASGGLKILAKPSIYNVGPHGFQVMKASFKTTESGDGVIYGTITYDGTSANDSFIVNMKEIKVDVLQIIKQSNISDTDFRSKWVVLEWENKISIESNQKDLKSFLKLLMDKLKMKCVNVEPQLDGTDPIDYLVANLACSTVGGQDILTNVCVRKEDDLITGHCRIRSQLQGIVYSLGEKVTSLMNE